jgi:hypothetical protein
MRRFLHIDEETRELHMVVFDLWDGKHERTAFRVIDADRRPLRGEARWSHLDGEPVVTDHSGHRIRHYCTPRALVHPAIANVSDRVYFDVEDCAVGPTEKTPCPRSKNRRRRCDICRAEERQIEAWNARAARDAS